MSIAIQPELHEELKAYAKKRRTSASAYIGVLVEPAIKISIDEEPLVIGKPIGEAIVPVVLKIPASLKGNREGLREWMESQSSLIVSKLS